MNDLDNPFLNVDENNKLINQFMEVSRINYTTIYTLWNDFRAGSK